MCNEHEDFIRDRDREADQEAYYETALQEMKDDYIAALARAYAEDMRSHADETKET